MVYYLVLHPHRASVMAGTSITSKRSSFRLKWISEEKAKKDGRGDFSGAK